MRRAAASARLTTRCEAVSSPCPGTWRATPTTGRAPWEAAAGRAGGPRPWSTAERTGRASGSGESGRAGAALGGALGVAGRGRQGGPEAVLSAASLCHSPAPPWPSSYGYWTSLPTLPWHHVQRSSTRPRDGDSGPLNGPRSFPCLLHVLHPVASKISHPSSVTSDQLCMKGRMPKATARRPR